MGRFLLNGEWRIQYFAYIVLSFSPHVRACYVIYATCTVNIITNNTFIHDAIHWMLIHNNNSIGLYIPNQVIATDLNWMPFSSRVSMTEIQIACELILKIIEMCCLRGKQYDNSIISVAKCPNVLACIQDLGSLDVPPSLLIPRKLSNEDFTFGSYCWN